MSLKRCAIYTRKSTDEGLDQAFNSLDAQREACRAYVLSQKHEGWTLVKKSYDDGGFSGGSMERPALKQLLGDIAAGTVDVVVVYKIDRLTRSLADFAKMVELFDAKAISFVSVTQQFNTTTSMGRLTLNVLLSFAQFEREVTAERIRDKIAASRKKGIWMGGSPPLGYDIENRKLVPNPEEAKEVQRLFKAYLELGSVRDLRHWAEANGIRTKIRRRPDGSIRSGGRTFSRGNLHALLSYRTYIGEVQHKGSIYPGEQEAIIPRDLWDRVQAKLRQPLTTGRSKGHQPSGLALTGLVFDETGDRLSPTYATKEGRRYGYYVSRRLVEDDASDASGWRLPAATLERAVVEAIATFLSDQRSVLRAIEVHHPADPLPAHVMNQILNEARQRADKIQQSNLSASIVMAKDMIDRIEIGQYQLQVRLRLDRIIDADTSNTGAVAPNDRRDLLYTLSVPFEMRRRGVETHLIVGGSASASRSIDDALVRTIAQARSWFERLQLDSTASIKTIAEQVSIPASEVSRTLPLAFLAPKIVKAILRGEQPIELTTTTLLRRPDLPMDWTAQEAVLGFGSSSSELPQD